MKGDSGSHRPLRIDAVRNQEKLLSAARALFAAEGLEAPLEDIARRANVGIATLYRRFPDRESLVAAVFESRVKEMAELADAALEITDSWEAFSALLWSVFRMIANDKGLRELLIGFRFDAKDARAGRAGLIQRTSDVIIRAQKDGRLRPEITENDIPPLVLMIGGIADFSASSNPDLWERYAVLLLDGLSSGGPLSHLKPGALSADEMTAAMSRL